MTATPSTKRAAAKRPASTTKASPKATKGTAAKAAAAKAAAPVVDEVAARRETKQQTTSVDVEAARQLVELREAATLAQLTFERYVRQLIATGAKPAHVAKAAGIATSSVANYVKREQRGQPV